MKSTKMHDKILELYIKKENPDMPEIRRNVEKYLRQRYSENKIQRLVDDMLAKYNFIDEAQKVKCQNKLSSYIDSMVIRRIRDSYKTSNTFDIDELDEMKFKALVKQVVLNFGYEVLFVPRNTTSLIDIIVHRGDVKVAVLAVKCAKYCSTGIRSVRQIKYTASNYNCEQSLLISSNDFEPEAVEEAQNIGVTLIDREKLLPLVQDLIENRRKEETQLLVNNLTEEKETIFLDGQIKSPKTKVQVTYIKYYIDSDNHHLIFEGDLINTGKRPVSNLVVFIKIINRDGDSVSHKNAIPDNNFLESKQGTTFKLVFNELIQSDWKNICRYELNLEYNNVFASE